LDVFSALFAFGGASDSIIVESGDCFEVFFLAVVTTIFFLPLTLDGRPAGVLVSYRIDSLFDP
jgi:hypothetical protein